MIDINRKYLGSVIALERINTTPAAATGMLLDVTTDKIAYRFQARKTSGIAAVACNWVIVGAPGVFKIGIFEEDGSGTTRYPGATQLGGYTGNISAPASTGWTAMTDLATPTGNLTINAFYWIVVEYVSGNLDGSNSIQANRYGSSNLAAWLNQSMRHYNGTNWTTTTSSELVPLICVKHADNTYTGNVLSESSSLTGNDILTNSGSAQVQGIVFKCGSQIKIAGVAFAASKVGSPDALVWTLYQGNTSKASGSLPSAAIITNSYSECWFETPVLVDADTTLYLIASNANTSAYYRLIKYTVADDAWIDAVLPADLRMVYGTLGTPSSLTVNTSTINIPAVVPLFYDPATDFDQATSGGGGRPEIRGNNL